MQQMFLMQQQWMAHASGNTPVSPPPGFGGYVGDTQSASVIPQPTPVVQPAPTHQVPTPDESECDSEEDDSASLRSMAQPDNDVNGLPNNMSGLKIVVFLGSSRDGRQGEQVAKTITEMLKTKGHEVEIFDPLTLGGDGHVHQPLQFYKDASTAPEWQRTANQKIIDAQGYVVVTCEYNCQLPPGLTSTMDQFPPASYRHKPCAIISYSMGPFGGIRAAALARPFLSEFGMITTPTACTIPKVQDSYSDGKCTADRVTKNMDKVVAELTWYGTAMAAKIKADGIPTPAPELY